MARILDLGRLLARIAPELETRLAASPYADCRVRMRWSGGDPVELLLNASGHHEAALEVPLPLPGMAQLVFGYKPASVLLAAKVW